MSVSFQKLSCPEVGDYFVTIIHKKEGSLFKLNMGLELA